LFILPESSDESGMGNWTELTEWNEWLGHKPTGSNSIYFVHSVERRNGAYFGEVVTQHGVELDADGHGFRQN
jgi:hypothetical protein